MATTNTFAEGRYTVERVLGRGGMAVVYLARDTELDRPVALKVLADHLSADDEFSARFRREAQTAAQLAHPNIVQVYDAGEDEEKLFIVMEYVHGEPLDEVLAREGRLRPDDALGLAAQACAALDYAHAHGVVHRDVKPGNLLLRSDGMLKIADFGIARAGEATALTQVGTILGTLNYLSPEQARGEPVTPRSDLYSLGAVLYELVTGQPPRRFESVAELATLGEEAPQPVRDLAPDVAPRAEEAIMRCLARNPDFRPASAAELAAELQGETSASAPTVPLTAARGAAPTVPLAHRRGRRRRRLDWRPAGALVAVLLTALVLAFVALRGEAESDETGPSRVDPVAPAEDPLQQAQNLEEWLREHTAQAG